MKYSLQYYQVILNKSSKEISLPLLVNLRLGTHQSHYKGLSLLQERYFLQSLVSVSQYSLATFRKCPFVFYIPDDLFLFPNLCTLTRRTFPSFPLINSTTARAVAQFVHKSAVLPTGTISLRAHEVCFSQHVTTANSQYIPCEIHLVLSLLMRPVYSNVQYFLSCHIDNLIPWPSGTVFLDFPSHLVLCRVIKWFFRFRSF